VLLMARFLGNGRFRWKPVGFDFEEVFCLAFGDCGLIVS
jgi:hypothetical protein